MNLGSLVSAAAAAAPALVQDADPCGGNPGIGPFRSGPGVVCHVQVAVPAGEKQKRVPVGSLYKQAHRDGQHPAIIVCVYMPASEYMERKELCAALIDWLPTIGTDCILIGDWNMTPEE